MWIFPQHHQQIERFNMLIGMLMDSHSNSLGEIRSEFIGYLETQGRYNGRQHTDTASAGNHNIDEAFFYGLIYKFNSKVFVSEYGKLIHQVWDDSKKRGIVFLYSLFNIQFYHPAKKSVEAKVFPFRILFQVLTDPRIGYKIASPEMYFLYKLDSMQDAESFETLITSILEYRSKRQEIKDIFRGCEADFVKCQISATYCLGILKKFGFFLDSSDLVLDYQYILSPNRRDATPINVNYLSFNLEFLSLMTRLLEKYSIYETPRENPMPSDLISEIFHFIDNDLYAHISIQKAQNTVLADDIYESSINPEKCYEFETHINKAINLFYNVKSEVIGGSGEPDFVAAYLPEFPLHSNRKIFTGDAKSTKNQLSGINPGRLKQHMQKHKSNFTILVTPKYSPASKKDIVGENIVILSSLALSEVARHILIRSDRPDFGPFYELIENNLGQDISQKFYTKIEEIYGISA